MGFSAAITCVPKDLLACHHGEINRRWIKEYGKHIAGAKKSLRQREQLHKIPLNLTWLQLGPARSGATNVVHCRDPSHAHKICQVSLTARRDLLKHQREILVLHQNTAQWFAHQDSPHNKHNTESNVSFVYFSRHPLQFER